MATKLRDGTWKLDMDIVESNLRDDYKRNPERFKQQTHDLQVAVEVMIGGGMLGKFAATQPSEFYIDDRVGKLPYPKRHILQAVAVLALHAKVMGLKDLESNNRYHACGIW